MNVHLIKGMLTCPVTGKEFPVTDGIPKMMLEEEECERVRLWAIVTGVLSIDEHTVMSSNFPFVGLPEKWRTADVNWSLGWFRTSFVAQTHYNWYARIFKNVDRELWWNFFRHWGWRKSCSTEEKLSIEVLAAMNFIIPQHLKAFLPRFLWHQRILYPAIRDMSYNVVLRHLFVEWMVYFTRIIALQ